MKPAVTAFSRQQFPGGLMTEGDLPSSNDPWRSVVRAHAGIVFFGVMSRSVLAVAHGSSQSGSDRSLMIAKE